MVRLFLAVNTILFLGFGVHVFLHTPTIAENLGIGGVNTDGLYELRSNYGGVSLGAGLLCLLGAIRAQLQRPALFFLLTYTGGYALGRLLALPYDGLPSAALIAYGVFEAVTATIAFFLLRRLASTA
ncbi:MAG: DUF4345 family protein [Pseudomonadota bacterium]